MAPIARATLCPSAFVNSTTITFSSFACLTVSTSAPFATTIISSTPASFTSFITDLMVIFSSDTGIMALYFALFFCNKTGLYFPTNSLSLLFSEKPPRLPYVSITYCKARK
ncbi:Uncharacterised protein [Streptococcus pneumoniae]|nr:Uncharacterised protein [Streptococcus pneumoniae]